MDAVSTKPQFTPRKLDWAVIGIFSVLSLVTFIGVPLFGMTYGYSVFDWVVFGFFYIFTGLGITVGYHRMVSHRSFTCHPVVKFILLIAGGWAFENSAIRWSSDHVRHHSQVDTDKDPYNAKRGFWHSHILWVLTRDPHRVDKYAVPFRKDPMLVWQHRYYFLILTVGFAVPFIAGFLYNGLIGGSAVFCLPVWREPSWF